MTRGGAARVGPALLALLLALAVAGCGAASAPEPEPTGTPSPLAACQDLSAPPPASPASPSPAPDPPGDQLPDLVLPCFTGGEPFALADLRGPAVVNIWASWCGPCREELPILQEYAERAADRVHFLGVVTRDRRGAAASLATDLGVTFPALEDPDAELGWAVGAAGVPATLFVTADGEPAYLHTGPLDAPALERHLREQLGVTP